MKVYENVVIGSGYTSVGFALANPSTIILEKNQSADVNFYLPLKNFKKLDFTTSCDCAKELDQLFSKKGFYKDGMQNTNALECAFCEFILSKNINVLFKSTVVSATPKKDKFLVTYYTVNGLNTIMAKRVIDMTNGDADQKFLTVLFQTDDIDRDKNISQAYNCASIEKAFYDNRYALHFKVENELDYNKALLNFFEVWQKINTKAKILYVAPDIYYNYSTPNKIPKDAYFLSPIEALEKGYNFGAKGEN